ncbi:MAG: O-antigen/teichoic acid export membrane protein [Sphingobacteriales bacterium]|jgi:O-antigen/teichoic acid export membrane protein
MPSGLQKILGQTAIYGLSSVVARVLNYFLVPLYTRLLLPEAYGVVSEFYAYIAIFAVILSHGMETAFFRFGEKSPSAKGTAFRSITFFAILLCGSAFIFPQEIATLIDRGEFSHLIYLSAIILILDSLAIIPLSELRLTGKPIPFASARLIGIVVNLSLNIYWFVGVGWIDITAIFWANIAGSAATLIFVFARGGWKGLLVWDNSLWQKMGKYAWPIAIAGLAYVINEAIDRILLRYLLPADTADYMVGIYSACYKLSILMSLCVQAYRMGVEPYFFNSSDAAKEQNLKRLMYLFSWFGGGLFMAICSQMFWLKGFIGENYHEGLFVVPILVFANGMLGVYFNLSYWYKSTDKTYYGALFSVFGALITLAINIALIPTLGYLASAWATLLCYLGMTVLSAWQGHKKSPVHYNWFRIGFYWLVPVLVYFCFQSFFNTTLTSLFVSLPFGVLWFLLGYKTEIKKKATTTP